MRGCAAVIFLLYFEQYLQLVSTSLLSCSRLSSAKSHEWALFVFSRFQSFHLLLSSYSCLPPLPAPPVDWGKRRLALLHCPRMSVLGTFLLSLRAAPPRRLEPPPPAAPTALLPLSLPHLLVLFFYHCGIPATGAVESKAPNLSLTAFSVLRRRQQTSTPSSSKTAARATKENEPVSWRSGALLGQLSFSTPTYTASQRERRRASRHPGRLKPLFGRLGARNGIRGSGKRSKRQLPCNSLFSLCPPR